MHSTTATSSTLSASDLRILDTAHLRRTSRELVACELGLLLVAYHQRLNRLIDNPHAEAARPLVVHRLRRLREQNRAARSARRLSWA